MTVQNVLYVWRTVAEVILVYVTQDSFQMMMARVKVINHSYIITASYQFVLQILMNVLMVTVMKLDITLAQMMKHASTLLAVIPVYALRATN